MENSSLAQPAKRNFKISVFGEPKSGKSLLIDFMKFERLAENTGDDDGIFTTGNRPDQITNNYQSTWGLKCHDIRQPVTDSLHAHMQVYEVGSVFISRFPHYLAYLTEEADLMVYTVSVDIETDA